MQTLAVAYPYFDWRFHNRNPELTDTARHEIESVVGPIVEIGGPTERGFRLLQDLPILTSRPEITNVPDFFGTDPQKIDKLVDGMDMPYEEGSIGMFLASSLATVDFVKLNKTVDSADFEHEQKAWETHADEEYQRILSDSEYNPTHNLRIGVLKEMTRVLRSDGLILFEAIGPQDIAVASALGHNVIQQSQAANGGAVYDCLFKKSSEL